MTGDKIIEFLDLIHKLEKKLEDIENMDPTCKETAITLDAGIKIVRQSYKLYKSELKGSVAEPG